MHELKAESLRKEYSGKAVVNGISLALKSGEVVGLLGPNGAGKTTTFYMIVGIIKPNAGSITLDGGDIGGLAMYKRARAGISYLPQEPSIFRKLTVRENLQAVLETTGKSKEEMDARVDQILEEFRLADFADREGFRLSGGERRRAEIARCIAVDPKFILFDEPFAGIDPIAIIELKKMMGYLKDKGLGILITDHNVRDTLSITDRAYIVAGGRILADGKPDELVANETVKDTYLGEDFKL